MQKVNKMVQVQVSSHAFLKHDAYPLTQFHQPRSYNNHKTNSSPKTLFLTIPHDFKIEQCQLFGIPKIQQNCSL